MFPCLTTCPVPLLPLPPQLTATAQALYDAVVARYSSPATAALGCLLLPYLFPELSAFATVKDLFSHLRARDTRYRAAVPAEFLDKNQPPMFITLYFIVTRLLDSLRSVKDQFLSLDPTSLTVDLLKQHLLAAETSAVAVGAARGTPRPPFFEGCSPSPLAPSYASAAAADVSVAEDVGAASASVKRRSGKGKGGKGGGGGSSGGGGGSGSSGGGSSGGGGGGTGGGSGGSGGGGGGSGTGGGGTRARHVGSRGGHCLYVIRTGDRAGQTCGQLHTQHRCFSHLDDAWRAEFGDDVELPRWADLLRYRIAIFDLDFDAILSAMYALSVSAEGDCYRCVPPDPGIAAAALGASESGTLPGTAPAQALHTFTLDSGTSACFFCDSTTLTPLSTLVPASPAALACPALPPLRRGAAARRSSLLISLDHCPLQTLHMDVWGPARVSRQSRKRYILLVVDDYTRYTTVFPLRSKGQDLAVLILHSDRGGEFSSNLLQDFCRGEGILQSFTLPDSPQKNGIAERRIGLVKEVAHTTMIHAAAPHFLWPFAVQYAAHQLNLWPRVSLSETLPTLHWTREVGDASVFRSPSSRPPPAQGPAPSGVSQVDPLPGPAPVQVAVDLGAARGAAFGGAASGGAASGIALSGGGGSEGVEPWGSAGASRRLSPQQLHEWFVQRARLRSGATGAGGAGGAGAGGAGGAVGAGVVGGTATTCLGGARTWGTGDARSGGVEGAGAGDPTESGATGAGGSGAGGTGAIGAVVGGTGAGGAGVGGPGFGGAGARGAGAVDPGGAVRPRQVFVPLLQQVLGTPSSPGLTPPLLCPPPNQSQPPLQPASPLPAPSAYTEQSGGLIERCEPVSRPISPVRTTRRVPRSRAPPVPGTHTMTLRPSSVPLRVPLPAPPESSLPEVPDGASDRARAASPTVSRLLATAVSNPCFESATASAHVAELLEFVAESASASPPSVGGECSLGTDVLEDRQEDFECLAAAVPRFASMLLAPEGDPDAPDIPTPRSYAEAITGTYIDEVPPRGANIVDGMWIFRVKRPPGSPLAFKARYVARGFSQRRGVDYFQAFSSTPKMTTLRVLQHVTAQRTLWSLRRPVYGLRKAPREWHDTLRTTLAALGFAPSTADPSLAWRTITLTESHMVHQALQRFGFQFSSPQPTTLSTSHSLSAPPSDESVDPSGPYPELVGCLMYLMTCTLLDLAYPLSLLARYVAPSRHQKVHWDATKRVLRYLCSTSGMGLVLGGRGPAVLTGHADASLVDDSATQWLSYGYTFSLGSGSVSWWSTRSSSVLSSSCEAEIYAGAMAA
ncbi:unnamed protein product [Closterium sp. NIES-53]